ncbi:tetratricopeptide repeat protein [Devosia beringensis]|uniref:tetratricopeptide repeat protein n=1 Tax=Devosia beringensis TaxID=2657486 RepID=UPI00186B7B24|nr:tetratricopeptide repeat protein [Devosia beringensis]
MIRTTAIVFALLVSVPAFGQQVTSSEPPTSVAALSDRLGSDPERLAELLGFASERVRAEADEGNAGAAFSLAKSLLAAPDATSQEEGLVYLEQAAEAGIVPAQVQLASVLRTGGAGVVPDPPRALELLEDAAALGDTSALLALGVLVLDTQLGKASRDRAVSLIEQAANAGDVNAANLLGGLYAQGRGVPLDVDKAMLYFEMSMVAGNSPAMMMIADIFRGGSGPIAADPDKAKALYVGAAARGNQGAARRLADMYFRGEGVPSAPDTALQMLSDLAGNGDGQANITLADYYLSGDIIPINVDTARDYFQKAADSGNSAGLIRLGELYRLGAPGMPADVNRAIDYFNRAIELGAPGAERYLANIFLDLAQPVANPSRGIELLKVAAAKGDANAAVRLGDLYSVNDLVQADYETSKSYFDLALSYGNPNAVIDLAQALVAGPLGTTHRQEALTLLRGSVESGLPGASTELARLQLAGTFPSEGLSGVLTMLLESTHNGDADAARYLMQLYREGYGLVLSPDRPAAENLLATLGPVLGEEGVAMQRILLLTPDRVSDESLAAIDSEFSKLTRFNGLVMLEQLRNNNAHAYVYIVQKRLSERGIYQGPVHGTLDSRTIGAMRVACERMGATRICDAGPLTNGAVQVIGNFLFNPVVKTAESNQG